MNANTLQSSSTSFDDANSHQFIQTSFGKGKVQIYCFMNLKWGVDVFFIAVECKVCSEVMEKESVFCEGKSKFYLIVIKTQISP